MRRSRRHAKIECVCRFHSAKGEFSGESPQTMRHESGQSTYILWAPRPAVHGNAAKENIANKAFPSGEGGRALSEVGRGKYRFAELLLYVQSGSALFRPLRGHLPQRGRHCFAKGQFTILQSVYGRGALRMLAINPAFVTHCPRRLAAKFPFTIFLSTAGRGAQRMLAINPALVTHCPRRLAAKFSFICL